MRRAFSLYRSNIDADYVTTQNFVIWLIAFSRPITTGNLYRVNLAFNHLQPFGSVAFPILTTEKNELKGPIFVDESLTSLVIAK